MVINNMIKLLLVIIFSFLSSCTSVELAANLSKKVFLKKDQSKYSKAIYKIGNPYVVDGKKYFPKKNLNYDEKGIASWYVQNSMENLQQMEKSLISIS